MGRMDAPDEAAGPVPPVVLPYGGSWRTGVEEAFPFVAVPFVRRGADP